MAARRRGVEHARGRADARGIVVQGWSLFAHPLFLDQLESLAAAVEAERVKGKRHTANQKVLRGIYRYAFGEIPRDPNDVQFRLGNALGPEYRHWFRAKFGGGRFRLFYRFQTRAKVIVLTWVNDETTLRIRGSKHDAYAVFRRMLESGMAPDSWGDLFSAATSPEAVRRMRDIPLELEPE